MSNYNVGDIIRMTRESMGMSQEELCFDICSEKTLSRIENGKVGVKRKVYKQLMERMGRNGAKTYSVLAVKDFEVLDIRFKVDTAIFRREYSCAEKHLEQLKEGLDLENTVNMQYVNWNESVIRYRLGKSTKEEYLKEMEEAIELTITDYEGLLHKVYPFTVEEAQILMNIAYAYNALGDKEKAIAIDYMLIRSLNKGYMRQKEAIQLIVILISAIAWFYGGMGKHETACSMSRNAIQKAKKNKLFSILPNSYAELAWNMMKQIEKGERDKKDLELCKQYFRQGYAAAVISNQGKMKDIIEQNYKNDFNEDIYNFSSGSYGESSTT